MKGYFYTSQQVNPYVNLAVEEWLLGLCAPVLYLWQNGPSVIIGRNQNAYTECNLGYARDNDILIARRNTGGGAVYHDLGNINFSIILPRELHDITRSTAVILHALQSLGIGATASGRNDILIKDQKISGNAYYSNARVGLHHGTILYRVDRETLAHVLSVSVTKTSRHGIASVKSRVTDITSHYPDISIDDIYSALHCAFCAEYGFDALETPRIKTTELDTLRARLASPAWIFDRINEYDVSREGHFPWGSVRVSVLFEGTTPLRAEVTSDSLDPDLIDAARYALNSHGNAPAAHNPAIDAILNIYREITSEGAHYDH